MKRKGADAILDERVIPVNGDEALLVNAADQIMRDARSRAEQCERETGRTVPLLFLGGEKEAEIVRASENLERAYREKFGLQKRPLLIVNGSQQIEPNQVVTGIRKYNRKNSYVPTTLELQEILLQRAMFKRVGERIYLWNGGFYERLTEEKLRTVIHEQLRAELGISGISGQLSSIQAWLMSNPDLCGKPLDDSRDFLCVGNGVLDLHTFQLRPCSPNYFFTSRVSVDWRGALPCPCFERFLFEISGGNETLIRRLWETIGYLLVPENCGKRFVLLQGHGNTGKSVLGRLLGSFFDPELVSSVDIFRFGERFSLSSIVGKRLNVSMDLTDKALGEQAVAILKQLTGGDLVLVEEKYKAPFSAFLGCKLLFGTNHALRLASTDRALAQRVLLIPFAYPVPKERQDRDLLEKLKAERSAILYGALAAYREVVGRGYFFTGDDVFTLTTQQGYADASHTEEDGVLHFIQDICTTSPGSFVPVGTLHESYQQYCRSKGYPSIQDRSTFSRHFLSGAGKRLQGCFRQKQRVNGVPTNVFCEIRMRE